MDIILLDQDGVNILGRYKCHTVHNHEFKDLLFPFWAHTKCHEYKKAEGVVDVDGVHPVYQQHEQHTLFKKSEKYHADI